MERSPSHDHHSDEGSSPSLSSTDDRQSESIHAPVPLRPNLPSRKSSGTMIVPRDSWEGTPVDIRANDEDYRPLSPRKTIEDIEMERREKVQRHAKALQDSIMTILGRIEAVKEEHDKLDNHNKFLQKYIGDLMATSKITSSGGRAKK